MELPTIAVTSPLGHTTLIDLNASRRYLSPLQPPSPPRPGVKSPLHSRKPPHLRLNLFHLLFCPPRASHTYPSSRVDMTQFLHRCTCPRDTFCHVCFLTAQEMATELSLHPVAAAGKCKCARGLPGSFCDACYTDFDRWMRRLERHIASAKEERKRGPLMLYRRGERWCLFPLDRDLHLWEAHQEVLDWQVKLMIATGGSEARRVAVSEREALGRLVREFAAASRLTGAGHRPQGFLPASTLPSAQNLEVGVPPEQGQTDPPVQGSLFGQWLYSLWDNLEVAGFMHENGIPHHRSRESAQQAKLWPSTTSTNTDDAMQAPQPEKKKAFWKRSSRKLGGKRARFMEKLRKLGLWRKGKSTKSSEPWEPFYEYDLDRL
ncbi:hypothetical protein BR93DRAFT_971059 [Coniochaeta sp. PMI_546]|nr:hypothetical protein BR93DRAFT_971059 [Coniochaeta sp. PMI_546]